MIFILPDVADGYPGRRPHPRTRANDGQIHDTRAGCRRPARFRPETLYDLGGDMQAAGHSPCVFHFPGRFQENHRRRAALFLQGHPEAFVDVNESGTEAAAATALTLRAGSAMPRPTPVFRAGGSPVCHLPVHDAKTGQILFMGRVADPRK